MSAIARMADQPEHSPLGASGAERWMNCPGSNVLLKLLASLGALPEREDSEFAKAGTAAHELAAHCLKTDIDTWECVGMQFYGVVVDQEMADAVQTYLTVIRGLVAEHHDAAAKNGMGPSNVSHLIEEHVSDKTIHPSFFGTADDVINGVTILDVTDFKYGVGIAVDAIENPQLKYYAVGVLAKVLGARRVRMRIVQPRAFHPDGPVRVFEMDASDLLAWRDKVLKPAMEAAEIDATLTPGEWCRFCPAIVACPMIQSLYKALSEANPTILANMTDEQLGMNYELVGPAMMGKKAYEEEVFRRLNRGNTIPGAKLVPKRSIRVLTAEGQEKAVVKFGDDAYNPKELKSPAEIDKIGPEGKKFTKEYAYSPDTGYTVASAGDKRVEAKVLRAADAFAHYRPDATSDAS
jgi:hypothetical protein